MKIVFMCRVLSIQECRSVFEYVSNAFDIVAREGTEEAGPLAGAHVPTVVTLFQHADHIALLKFQFVIILRCVCVKCSVSTTNQIRSNRIVMLKYNFN